MDSRRQFPASAPYLAAFVVAFALLYAQVFVDLVKNWFRDPNYSHGFAILPISAYLVWLRRDRIAAVEPNPNWLGLLLVAGSLIMLLVGTAGVEYFLMRTSAIGVVTGAVLYVGGTRLLRVLAFPLAFSLLMIPLPAIVFYRIAFPLQLLATRFGVSVLQLAHIPVLREGNVIQLAHTTLEVAEACSGIRSLVSLFSLAVLYGYFVATRPMVRAIIAISSVPIAIVANGLRVAGTGIAANYVGPAAATGFFHTFSGWLVFVASFAMLATIASALRGLRLVVSRVSA